MTLSEFAINEFMSVFGNGHRSDLVRHLAEFGMQELIETEAIGADRWERTLGRKAHLNGHRLRTLSTTAGDLDLRIPKFDRGRFS